MDVSDKHASLVLRAAFITVVKKFIIYAQDSFYPQTLSEKNVMNGNKGPALKNFLQL